MKTMIHHFAYVAFLCHALVVSAHEEISEAVVSYDGGFIINVTHDLDHIPVNATVTLFDTDCKNQIAGPEVVSFLWDEFSHAPSSYPTSSPSSSSKPSSKPSYLPSSSPSNAPSSVPSSKPSYRPSSSPSNVPSSVPSSKPSLRPTNIASSGPSSKPSSSPSSRSSSKPSPSPTIIQSSRPSSKPSLRPTGAPTSETNAPTRMHSSIPTASPSNSPTPIPTEILSSLPTEILGTLPPSSVPSARPSALVAPSLVPSSAPSKVPPQVLVTTESSLTLRNVDSSSMTDEEKQAFLDALYDTLTRMAGNQTIEIMGMNGEPMNSTNIFAGQLEDLVIDFKIIQSFECENDCVDSVDESVVAASNSTLALSQSLMTGDFMDYLGDQLLRQGVVSISTENIVADPEDLEVSAVLSVVRTSVPTVSPTAAPSSAPSLFPTLLQEVRPGLPWWARIFQVIFSGAFLVFWVHAFWHLFQYLSYYTFLYYWLP